MIGSILHNYNTKLVMITPMTVAIISQAMRGVAFETMTVAM